MTATRTDTNVTADLSVTATFAVDIATSLSKPTVSPASPKHGKWATFTTHLSPVAAATQGTTRLYLWRYESKWVHKMVNGRKRRVRVKYWRLRRTLTMKADASGHLTVKYRLRYRGKWRMYAKYSGSSIYTPCSSAKRTFRVK